MTPYIMGYIKARVDPNLPNESAIWLSALALGIQGFSMPVGGIVARRFGYRRLLAISCILDSGSVLLTYFTIQKTFIGVVATYSVLLGAGLGSGYSVVLATASTWFPAQRGLIVGLIVAGFGLGALVFTPIQTAIINPTNIKVNNVTRHFTDPVLLDRVPRAFLILGGTLLFIQVIGFALLRAKPVALASSSPNQQSEQPATSKTEVQPDKEIQIQKDELNVTPKQLFRCLDFYLLWFVMFCNIIPITIITSAYKLFGQVYISDDRFLSAIATASSMFNAGGRVAWGAIVDRISFKIPMCVMLSVWAFILITFPHIALATGISLKILYAIWVSVLFFSLSGVFVVMPAATSNLFGPVHMAVNYGLVFNAFAFGSVLCAIVTSTVRSKNAYMFQFTACACVCILALFIAIWLKDRKIPRRFNFCRWCEGQCSNVRTAQDHMQRLKSLGD